MRVKTRELSGDAEQWDPAEPEPFIALAGAQFIGTEGEVALVRDSSGCVLHAHPGWLAVRADGSKAATFSSQQRLDRGVWGPE